MNALQDCRGFDRGLNGQQTDALMRFVILPVTVIDAVYAGRVRRCLARRPAVDTVLCIHRVK